MWRFAAASLLAAALTDPGRAAARPTPCAVKGLPAEMRELRQRLDRSPDRAAWALVGADAAALAQRTEDPAVEACAHYLAGGAHFFLSDRGAARRRHAVTAVRHLLAALALAPESMGGTQPRARLRAAWQRVGRVSGWSRRAPVPVTVTASPRVARLHLGPVDPEPWIESCGGGAPCREAIDLEIALPAGAPVTLALPPGRYAVGLEGACGKSRAEVEIGRAGGPLRPPAPPPCPVTLVARDGEHAISDLRVTTAGGEVSPAAKLTAAAGVVTVEAPGYLPTPMELPPAGGEVEVRLERCPVVLEIAATPADAVIEGAGPAPWGLRTVRARRAGHLPVVREITVMRPARCEGARFPVKLVLSRRVSVLARGADGALVTPARLFIDQTEVPVDGFDRPPGRYAWRAEHPERGVASGELEVLDCAHQRECGAAVLDVRFPKGRERGAGPALTLTVGGAALAGGLIAGAAALSTQGDIDGYTTKREEGSGIGELIDRRDTEAATANVLVIAGGVTLTAGLIWYLLSGDR